MRQNKMRETHFVLPHVSFIVYPSRVRKGKYIMPGKKIRIGLIFGGRSGEHEVSLASATSVMANLDPNKYEVVPIGITPAGAWLLGAEPAQLLAARQGVNPEQSTAVTLTSDPNLRRLIPIQGSEPLRDNGALDVIFPVLHGTY